MSHRSWKRFLFLVRREFLFQLDGRRTHARGIYPGVTWFALICLAFILLEFNSSRLAPYGSSTVIEYFSQLSSFLVILIGLRATVYCSVSFARDLQNQSATIVSVTPISQTAVLAAKICACLAPLWLELLVFLPIALAFFSVYLPWTLVLAQFLILFLVSLTGGCLGLGIGSMSPNPSLAARSARGLILFLLPLVYILDLASDGFLLPSLGVFVWLLASSRQAPHRAAILVGALVLGAGLMALEASLGNLALSRVLHPLNVTYDIFMRAARVDQAPTFAYLANVLPAIVFYLSLCAVFFGLAKLRYRYAR